MTYIKLLSDDLIGKIAAGEVVERPASVVKELVENSIDAGSKEIIIEIASGGRKRIAVIDDGFGMSSSDAKLSIQRHATSKLFTADDLNTIRTMGFRGEALPSIAAVSKMTIETQLASHVIAPVRRSFGGSSGGIAGFKLVVSGGTVIEEGDFGCPSGTRVVIDDLFFNTPARKKFLRSDKTEEGHIVDTISRLAVAFPQIRFKLISEGKDKLTCLSVNNPEARLSEVFGDSLAASAVPFNENGNGISIHGFLGRPESSRQVAQGVYLFVNKRFVRDRLLSHAVLDGYRSLLPHGSYPFAVVFLEIDPDRVDVNVHPTKQEVRFDNSGAVHNFVAAAVRKTMGQVKTNFQIPSPLGDSHPPLNPLPRHYYTAGTASREGKRDTSTSPLHIQNEAFTPAGVFSSLKVIGQLSNSFILCESGDGALVAIDQHAAHERIGFEKLKTQLDKKKIEQQHLLIPEQVELPPKDAASIGEHIEELNSLGLEIEPFGGNSFIVKSMPALLSDTGIQSLISKLAREFSEIGRSSSVEEVTEHILKTFACHTQVRANHQLEQEEMSCLLKEMDVWPNADLCPHGRPTFIEFNADEIAKWFKRT
jgi:DNA mismatch repair protein MutL